MDIQELRMVNNVVAALGNEPVLRDNHSDILIAGKAGETSLQEYFVQAIVADQTALPRDVDDKFNLFKTLNDVLSFEPDAVNLTVADGAARLAQLNDYTWAQSGELWHQYLTTLVKLSETSKLATYFRQEPELAPQENSVFRHCIWRLKTRRFKIAESLESQFEQIRNTTNLFSKIPGEKFFENGETYHQRTTKYKKELSAKLRESSQITLPLVYQIGHQIRIDYKINNNAKD